MSLESSKQYIHINALKRVTLKIKLNRVSIKLISLYEIKIKETRNTKFNVSHEIPRNGNLVLLISFMNHDHAIVATQNSGRNSFLMPNKNDNYKMCPKR